MFGFFKKKKQESLDITDYHYRKINDMAKNGNYSFRFLFRWVVWNVKKGYIIPVEFIDESYIKNCYDEETGAILDFNSESSVEICRFMFDRHLDSLESWEIELFNKIHFGNLRISKISKGGKTLDLINNAPVIATYGYFYGMQDNLIQQINTQNGTPINIPFDSNIGGIVDALYLAASKEGLI